MAWHDRIQFYPKSPFYYAVVIAILGVVLSVITANFWLEVVIAIFLALMIVSMLLTLIQLKGLRLKVIRLERGFVEQTIYLSLEITETAGVSRDTLRFQWHELARTSIELNAYEKKIIHIPISSRHRGTFNVKRVRVFSDYPLGLFEISMQAKVDAKTIIYAKPLMHAINSNKSSHKIKRLLDEPTDFWGFRNYHAGDSLRSIAWKQWSKGVLLTKMFSHESAREVVFSAKDKDFSEDTISRLTREIIDAHKSQQKYGLILPHVSFSPDWGDGHRHRCLEAIATWRQA